jgi:hypothetical protein
LLGAVSTAEKCQEATYAPQQTMLLFDHLVSQLLKPQRRVKAERLRRREVDDELYSRGVPTARLQVISFFSTGNSGSCCILPISSATLDCCCDMVFSC